MKSLFAAAIARFDMSLFLDDLPRQHPPAKKPDRSTKKRAKVKAARKQRNSK